MPRVFILATSLAWLPSRLALADAVPPPPDDCPKGQVGTTSHGGPRCEPEAPTDCAPGYRGVVGGTCVLAACSSDKECDAGRRCLQVDACQVLRELHWTGWGWSAQRSFASGNLLGGPPAPAPEGSPPKAWVKLHICGQDGPCEPPAECRPMGLCYPPGAVGKTKAAVAMVAPPEEKLPDGVYSQSLIAPNPKGDAESLKNAGCRKGCSVSSTPERLQWFALPLLAGVALYGRRRRQRYG